MKVIDHQHLVLAAVCQILTTLRQVEARLGKIEETSAECLSEVRSVAYDEDEDDQVASSAAIADQMLDAADDISEAGSLPNCDHVAEQLREIAKALRESSW